jgi:hypothetical protein
LKSGRPVGLESFESPGVEPVFPQEGQAIDYAQSCACCRSGKILILSSTAISNARLRSVKRIESCENAIIKTLAILWRFPANCLYARGNRLQIAV